MADIVLNYGDDYPLNGVITAFEAYMFITTDKFIRQHEDTFPCSIIMVDGKSGRNEVKMQDLKDRKAALTAFNKMASARIPSIPKPTGLSCVLVDLTTESEDYQMPEMEEACTELSGMFARWCEENDRVGVIVPHMLQDGRWPHVHILYQRGRGKHNEFQDWLSDQLG